MYTVGLLERWGLYCSASSGKLWNSWNQFSNISLRSFTAPLPRVVAPCAAESFPHDQPGRRHVSGAEFMLHTFCYVPRPTTPNVSCFDRTLHRNHTIHICLFITTKQCFNLDLLAKNIEKIFFLHFFFFHSSKLH